jgi:Domain of unknown function (DUF1707)
MMPPRDPIPGTAPGGGHLRASDADRERVLEALKTAFVQGRLGRHELGTRAAQALTSRTYAELAGATAGIVARPAVPPVPRRPAPPARRGPVSRRAVAWGVTAVIVSPGLAAAFVATYYGGFVIFLVLSFILATVTGSPAAPAEGRRGML